MIEDWNIVSSDAEGFHEVVSPEGTDCKVIRFFRLNLSKGNQYSVGSNDLEVNVVLVKGEARISADNLPARMNKLDSFYLPAGVSVDVEAVSDCVFYIPAAPFEGIGEVFFRAYQEGLEPGDVYQVHGSGASRREVFFTIDPNVPASRLICGYAFGGEGSWTSWPPHDHGEHLEELYCYFDMPKPRMGIQFSYLEPGGLVGGQPHVVRSGHVVLIPRGYHPTVATPGGSNTYLWAMASRSRESRRYDLAVPDPEFA